MKQAYIIGTKTGYVSNETGELVNITSEQALLDGFFTGTDRKYTFVELFTKLGEIKAKTLRQINELAWQYAEANNLSYDFQLYFPKK